MFFNVRSFHKPRGAELNTFMHKAEGGWEETEALGPIAVTGEEVESEGQYRIRLAHPLLYSVRLLQMSHQSVLLWSCF